MEGLCICANLYKVDLIDSMIVVDPQRRLTIEECLNHPWLTKLASGKETLAGKARVLRRIPTRLGSDKEIPLTEYIAPSEESEGLKAGPSLPDSKFTTSQTKGKGKLS